MGPPLLEGSACPTQCSAQNNGLAWEKPCSWPPWRRPPRRSTRLPHVYCSATAAPCPSQGTSIPRMCCGFGLGRAERARLCSKPRRGSLVRPSQRKAPAWRHEHWPAPAMRTIGGCVKQRVGCACDVSMPPLHTRACTLPALGADALGADARARPRTDLHHGRRDPAAAGHNKGWLGAGSCSSQGPGSSDAGAERSHQQGRRPRGGGAGQPVCGALESCRARPAAAAG